MTGSEQRAPLADQVAAEVGSPDSDREPQRITLGNEFATVMLELDTRANGPRLRVVNLGNGRSTFLDPLELASLTWLTHEDLSPFLDPSRTGWRSNGAVHSEEGEAQ